MEFTYLKTLKLQLIDFENNKSYIWIQIPAHLGFIIEYFVSRYRKSIQYCCSFHITFNTAVIMVLSIMYTVTLLLLLHSFDFIIHVEKTVEDWIVHRLWYCAIGLLACFPWNTHSWSVARGTAIMSYVLVMITEHFAWFSLFRSMPSCVQT